MKKYLFLFALSCISYAANATDTLQPKTIQTKINSLSTTPLNHINNQKKIISIINQTIIPNFSRCTVILPQEQKSVAAKNNFNSCQ